MKKILYVFGILMMTLVLVACGEDGVGVPTNLRIENETMLMWDAVEGADGYVVKAGTEVVEDVRATQLDLTVFYDVLEDGTYQVSVAATLLEFTSEYSTQIPFTVDTTLESVSNIAFDGTTLTWGAVEDATSYRITIGENVLSVSSPTFDVTTLSGLLLEEQMVQVTAVFGTELAAPTTFMMDYQMGGMDAKTFMLKAMNVSFERDMTAADFDTTQDYEMYEETEMMVDYYLDYSDGQDEAMAAKMFVMAMKVTTTEMTDPFELFEMFDDVEGMSGDDVAAAVMSFILALNAMDESFLLERKEILEVDVTTYEEELNKAVTTGVVGAFKTVMTTYLDAATFDQWFTTSGYDTSDIWYKVYVLFDAIDSLNFGYDMIQQDDDAYKGLQNVVLQADQADDTAFFDFFTNENRDSLLEYTDIMFWYQNTVSELEWVTEDLNNPLFATLIEDRASFELALATLVDYVLDVRTSIKTPLKNIETMLQSGVYTPAQIVNVKDQIVYGIYETLPEESVLNDAFEAIFTVLYSELGMPVAEVSADVESFVDQLLLMMQGFAEFMYMIDEDDTTKIIDLLEVAAVEVTPDVLLDALVLGAELVLRFEAEHPGTSLALRAQTLSIINVSILDMLSLNLGGFDPTLVSQVLGSLDNVLHPLLRAYMTQFVSSDAALIRELLASDDANGIQSMNTLIDELLPYVRATNQNLIGQEFETLLSELITLIAPILAPEFGFTEAEVLAMRDRVLTDVTVALYSIFSLSELIFETLEPVDLDGSDESAIIFELLDVLNDVNTDDQFTTIRTDLETTIKNILKDQDIITLLEATETEIDDMIDMVLEAFDGLMSQVAYVSSLNIRTEADFNALSDDDKQKVTDLTDTLSTLISSVTDINESIDVTVYYDPTSDAMVFINYSSETLDVSYTFMDANLDQFILNETIQPGQMVETNVPDALVAPFDVTVQVYDQDGFFVTSLYILSDSTNNEPEFLSATIDENTYVIHLTNTDSNTYILELNFYTGDDEPIIVDEIIQGNETLFITIPYDANVTFDLYIYVFDTAENYVTVIYVSNQS